MKLRGYKTFAGAACRLAEVATGGRIVVLVGGTYVAAGDVLLDRAGVRTRLLYGAAGTSASMSEAREAGLLPEH